MPLLPLKLLLFGNDDELGRVLGMVDDGFRGITAGALDDGTMGVDGPGMTPELPKEGAVVIAMINSTGVLSRSS